MSLDAVSNNLILQRAGVSEVLDPHEIQTKSRFTDEEV